MPTTANRVSSFGTTIFTEINVLAAQHGAINLGQGRPDFDGPADVINAAVKALQDGQHNQYAPGSGTATMRQRIADHAGKFYNLDIDPNTGVVVTSGATEAVFDCILGLIDPGDEVIVIEPYFDSYVPNLIMAGATPVYVPLRPPNWTLDPDELRRAFNKNTRALLWNSPQNPTGRVFTVEEMTVVAELCQEFDVTVISDEVYEHLVFETPPPNPLPVYGEGEQRQRIQHIPIATLPGMFERTVTASSLGKTFSVTGWKSGWVYGHPDLVTGVARAHQFVTFASHHPSQEAAAYALGLPGTYYEELQAMYLTKRDIMMTGLANAGLKASTPEGTYFVMADFSDVYDGDAVEFAKYLTTEIGVACIPPTFFYGPEHADIARKMARFAFCKSDDTLRAAGEKLKRLREKA
ncbi:MAG: aminotransferase class I/II-fold pyridoxal phosphate-dependent enzyme [Chloroflexota bacterium]